MTRTRANLKQLHIDVKAQTVNASEATTSTSFVDLATAGPSVSVEVGPLGILIVMITNQASGDSLMSFSVTGANTIAANDDNAVYYETSGGQCGSTFTFTGLNPGLCTVTMKYRSVTGASKNFLRRKLTAIGL